MKIGDILNEGGIADIPPRLFDIHQELYHKFKAMKDQLDPVIADDIQELFDNMDDDFHLGDAGMVKAGLEEVDMLLRNDQ